MDAYQGTDQGIDLSQGQLAALLDAAGVAPSGRSPLQALAADSDMPGLARLGIADQGGSLLGAWPLAAAALARPALRLTAAVGGLQGFRVLHACRAGAGGFTGCAPLPAGGWRISHPLDPDDVLAFLTAGLGLDIPTAGQEPTAGMSLAALFALAALADAVKEQSAEAWLARGPAPEPFVETNRVQGNLNLGLGKNDLRWLVSVTARICPFEAPAGPSAAAEGLEELRALGWANQNGDGLWGLSPELEELAPHLWSPAGFGFLTRLTGGEESAGLEHLGFFRTLASVWLLEFSGGDEPAVRVSIPPSHRLLDGLHAWLTETEPAPSSACPACGRATAPGDAFCTGCGARLAGGP